MECLHVTKGIVVQEVSTCLNSANAFFFVYIPPNNFFLATACQLFASNESKYVAMVDGLCSFC